MMIQHCEDLPVPSALVKNGIAHQVGGTEDTQRVSSLMCYKSCSYNCIFKVWVKLRLIECDEIGHSDRKMLKCGKEFIKSSI